MAGEEKTMIHFIRSYGSGLPTDEMLKNTKRARTLLEKAGIEFDIRDIYDKMLTGKGILYQIGNDDPHPPMVIWGGNVYEGLDQIKEFIEKWQEYHASEHGECDYCGITLGD